MDDAWNVFDSLEESENGLEVWRVVNLDAAQKTQSEIMVLEDAVLNPRKLKAPHDIANIQWDMAYRAFVDAGGMTLDDHRKCGALMPMLPDMMRTEVCLKYEQFADKPLALRQWVLHHAKLLVNWQDARGKKLANVLEADADGIGEGFGDGDESDLIGKLDPRDHYFF